MASTTTSKPARTPSKAGAKPATRRAAPAKAPAAKTATKKAAKTAPQAAARPAPEANAAPPEKAPKPPKQKLVRDSFTIPRNEYAALDALKQRLVALARPAKKSEVLRAGIKLLCTLDDAALVEVLAGVPSIKTGRPKADK